MTEKKIEGLELLRAKFPENTISKLPKPTKKQTDEVRADFKKGIRCEECGGWHHAKVVHLDYVGHAALTDRLLDCDPNWNWEPVTFGENGNPQFDSIGGMWIRLTVCGVTRLGYGNADGKTGGNAVKEVIGDALRNAAMRFGAALDLWHKGDLHGDDDAVDEIADAVTAIEAITLMDELKNHWVMLSKNFHAIAAHKDVIAAKEAKKAELSAPKDGDGKSDEIPY
jgi:hypothetical protein